MLPDMSLFETMHSQRAIRHFTTEPVPDEAIDTLLRSAIRAPNGGNQQGWHFLVIRDREGKRRLGEWYLAAWSAAFSEERKRQQAYRSGADLGHGMVDIPVVILVCTDHDDRDRNRGGVIAGASIYPAVQNLMLAARALGLGTVLTTMHTEYEGEVKEFFGIPDNVDTAALIPVGYPAEGEHFGGGRRRPFDEVTYYDRWGRSASPD